MDQCMDPTSAACDAPRRRIPLPRVTPPEVSRCPRQESPFVLKTAGYRRAKPCARGRREIQSACVPLESPSWRISGNAPKAELGAKRSTTRLICARFDVISTNKAWEG